MDSNAQMLIFGINWFSIENATKQKNREKMTESIPVEEASNEMLSLDQLKETVVAQYGDDARLILDSIDEVEAILLRRQGHLSNYHESAGVLSRPR